MASKCLSNFVFILLFVFWGIQGEKIDKRVFLHLTVASNATDGFLRLQRSAKEYNIPSKVLGLGQTWNGGDMRRPGGGYKVRLLREELVKYKDDPRKVILFTDGYDVILVGTPKQFVDILRRSGARILFSAEGFCWPDKSLIAKYPAAPRGKRFLNSGGFLGYATDMYELISSMEIKDTDDDQFFYTLLYLDEHLRQKYKVKLDHRAEIFQNLHGALDEVELLLDEEEPYVTNTVSNTRPLSIHGNGPTKSALNSLGNYIARSWSTSVGCLSCDENIYSLDNYKDEGLPLVVMALFITKPTPFLEEWMEKIEALDYPKSRIMVFIFNSEAYHSTLIDEFVNENAVEYNQLYIYDAESDPDEARGRNSALKFCFENKCDIFFNVDGDAHLDNPDTLRALLEQNRTVLAPMMTRPYEPWSNFWGALTVDGFYARSTDYMDIVYNDRRGVWNVPFISSCYILNISSLANHSLTSIYNHASLDPDMAFCRNLLEMGIFMMVTNRETFGHLVNPTTFDVTRKNPEVYQLLENRYDWDLRYIHPDFAEALKSNAKVEQPCPDVFRFPVMTERFTKELIEIMENFGQWSSGKNEDNRLEGGYENVPTRDIHMNQVGLEKQWLAFLKLYVREMQEKLFIGYKHDDPRLEGGYEAVPTRDIHMKQVGLGQVWDEFLLEFVYPLQQTVFLGFDEPPRSLMNFVVRYRPDEQPSLRPHHDSSTYTINLALNTAGIDYEGGGCRFLRYNCSVTDTKPGYMLMHPGRLTHIHEGLLVTKGTRYIMISFVDP